MTKLRLALIGAAVALGGALAGVVWMLVVLDRQVEARFRGRLFAIPSRVYSAPLVLFPGLDVERAGLLERLKRLNYHPARTAALRPGEYLLAGQQIEIGQRPFRYPYRKFSGAHVVVLLDQDSRVVSLENAAGQRLDTVEIEPELVAQFHGQSREDRRLVRLDEVPSDLIDAILAIEDRRFYRHHGVHLTRVVGALLANLRAGRVVQGGSTLTQQLVKNFYLTADRTLMRKFLEAVMALLLERRHTKDQIL